MAHLKSTLLLLAVCLPFSFLFTQPKAEKWGKISKEDLALTACPYDSTASAFILQDVGNIEVQILNSKLLVRYQKQRRLKVFDMTALDEGNLLIPYYSYKNVQKLTDLEVQVHYPNGEKQKVRSDNVYDEKLSKKYSAKKIFIPNLQPGCIIEYQYTILSENIVTLHTWYFQEELPVRVSDLTLTIPQFFSYAYLTRVNHPFDSKESGTVSRMGEGGSRYNCLEQHFVISNLPAIREEPFVNTIDNYRSYIQFQLQAINYQDGREEKYMTNWSDLAKQLRERSDFGGIYTRQNQMKDAWSDFKSKHAAETPNRETAEQLLRYVSKRLTWNGEYGLMSDRSVDKLFESGSGSSAEINLALVGLLQKAGFDAYPLLLSTRDNGFTFPEYPFIEQFNSVAVFVREGDVGYMLDATNPFHALGELQTNHFNLNAWVVDPSRPDWLDLHSPEYGHVWYGSLALQTDGALKGAVSEVYAGKASTAVRKALGEKSPENIFLQDYQEHFPEASLDAVQIQGRDTIGKDLRADYSLHIPAMAEDVNGFLYIKPVLSFLIEENPFALPDRSYPVNFPYPIRGQYVLNLNIPEGYVVEDLPESARIVLPENGGRLTYSCSDNGKQELQVMLKLQINQPDFFTEEYGVLRQFFELIEEKVQGQIVLKKI